MFYKLNHLNCSIFKEFNSIELNFNLLTFLDPSTAFITDMNSEDTYCSLRKILYKFNSNDKKLLLLLTDPNPR